MAQPGWYPAPVGGDQMWWFDGAAWVPPQRIAETPMTTSEVETPAEHENVALDEPEPQDDTPDDSGRIAAIESVLEQFGVDAKVHEVVRGPSVVRYELKLGRGVKVEKVSGLHGNLSYEVASDSVRILAPIPGKSAIGIELPNQRRSTVKLADVAVTDEHPLTVPIGLSVEGESITANIGRMPHLLVAGTTGSGKSCFINSLLVSLIHRSTPAQVRLVLIDPKMVELTPYDGSAHLLCPVITEDNEALRVLDWLTTEMDNRYRVMRSRRARQIDGLGFPYIVVVVDELADLMKSESGSEIEKRIVRLAQKARAAGIHLILSTQRPSVDVITGLIKANVPSRLAFSTASSVDSRVVLDQNGAEQLLGMGDGLFVPVGARHALRIQSPLVTDREVDEAARGIKRGKP